MTEKIARVIAPLFILPYAIGVIVFHATGNPWTGLVALLVGDAIVIPLIIFLQWRHEKAMKKKKPE